MVLKAPGKLSDLPAFELAGLFDHKRTRYLPGILRLIPYKITREGVVIEHHIREGRFQRSLSLITGFSSLLAGLEVTYEHYRGSYGQRIMYTPVILSALLAVAGVWSTFSRWAARVVLPITSALTVIDGVLGFYYHIRGIQRKPGGWRIPIFNLIMGPPLFAPLLFSTVGLLGIISSMLRREDDPAHTTLPGIPRPRSAWLSWLPRGVAREGIIIEQDVREGRFQRALAVVTAFSALFSWIESFYSHYKNNFSFRIQWSPIIIGPGLVIAALAAVWSRTIARTLMPLMSLIAAINGAMGFFYHVRGVVRRPGGLKTPFYNVVYGPPVLAPLLFASAGFTGLLASLLRRAK